MFPEFRLLLQIQENLELSKVKATQMMIRMKATVAEMVDGIAIAKECFLLARLFLMFLRALLIRSLGESFLFDIAFSPRDSNKSVSTSKRV
jgi:hypothetical protein